MESENPDDHQRVQGRAADRHKRYREKQKKKVENLKNEISHYIKEADHYKEKMKSILDVERETRKIVLEHGESSGHAREAVEKQTDFLNSMSRELLKTPLPGGGTCGGTSASTDKDACPPLDQLSVAAMKPDGSVTTESFKPCQLLPEQWTPLKHSACRKECRGSTSYSTEVLEGVPNPMESAMSLNGSVMSGSFKPCESLPDADKLAFNKLSELYIASQARRTQEKIRHAQEMAAIEARHTAAIDRHAQEMAAAKERHDKEMAATKDRHAQEMAAAKERHDQEMAAVKTEYLENMGQPPAEDSSNFDTNQFLVDEPFGW